MHRIYYVIQYQKKGHNHVIIITELFIHFCGLAELVILIV